MRLTLEEAQHIVRALEQDSHAPDALLRRMKNCARSLKGVETLKAAGKDPRHNFDYDGDNYLGYY